MARPKKEKPNRADGLYEVKITLGKTIKGKLIRKSFYSSVSKDDAKRQAEQYKIETEVSRRTGEIILTKDIGFSDWADKWLEVYKKPKVTVNTYNGTYKLYIDGHLKPHFGQTNLTDIKPIDVQDFFASKRELSESSLNKIRICLNGIFETAIDNDLCYKNPTKFADVKSVYEQVDKKVYTRDQEEWVYNLCITKMPAIVLCLETGIRPGEFAGLKWSDIKDGVLSVKRNIAYDKENQYLERPPKWDSYRDIPLTPRAVEALDHMKNSDIFIYPMDDDTPYVPRAWSKIVQRFWDVELAENKEFPQLTPHEFRHTFGTKLRRNGVDIYSIQKLMGHKNIKVTTETYVHSEIDVLKKAMGL